MIINCEEHFDKVTRFAALNGCLLKLAERLDYLTNYGGGGNVCHLYYDRAPNSFEFTILRADGSPWFNGGLIYSGPTQSCDDVNPSKHAWSVHT